MIFSSFFLALGQLGDPRFRRVVLLGVLLALALLVGLYALTLAAFEAFVPGEITIPGIGAIGGLDTLVSLGSFVLMFVMSIFLMVPVASALSGLFLEDVAQAVEDRHYPALPPVPRLPLMDSLIDSLNFIGLLIVVNLLSLVLYALADPLIPVVFWAVNGWLLGREYFTLVAMRRLGRDGAKALRARHGGTIWAAGTLMAAPLSIPLVNLIIPVLGVATFTHLFHRLSR